jgi:hypothetical protein
VPSRLDDPPQKIGYADGKWVQAAGSGGVAEATDEAVYLAISLRNVGSEIAGLHGWRFYPETSTREAGSRRSRGTGTSIGRRRVDRLRRPRSLRSFTSSL